MSCKELSLGIKKWWKALVLIRNGLKTSDVDAGAQKRVYRHRRSNRAGLVAVYLTVC
jgi:hypothetical protein